MANELNEALLRTEIECQLEKRATPSLVEFYLSGIKEILAESPSLTTQTNTETEYFVQRIMPLVDDRAEKNSNTPKLAAEPLAHDEHGQGYASRIATMEPVRSTYSHTTARQQHGRLRIHQEDEEANILYSTVRNR